MKITSETPLTHYVPKAPHLVTPPKQTPEPYPESPVSPIEGSMEGDKSFHYTPQEPHLITPANARQPLLPNKPEVLQRTPEERRKVHTYAEFDFQPSDGEQLHVSVEEMGAKKL